MSQTTFRKHGLEFIAHDPSPSGRRAIELPVNAKAVVLGAPGSGKTTLLKAIFLAKLEAGLKTSEILALAANREAANLLRDELALAHQGATAGPMARTLSSFAFSLLRDEALKTGKRSPELINGSEQDRILKRLLSEEVKAGISVTWPKHITEATLGLAGFRAELRELFTVCLEHEISVAELAELGESNNREVWVAASEIYSKYLGVLATPANENRHDPSTLLTKAAQLLESGYWPEFASEIKLVLVDDAQELTPGAKLLLKAIASKGAGLILLGDPDAATLGFRSANPEAMSQLIQEVAGKDPVATIVLEPVHEVRPAEISAAMANLVAGVPTARAGVQRKVLGATSLVEGDAVEAKVFDSPISEAAWVARRLRELHLEQNIPWGELAVVARSRSLLENFGAALANESVPATVVGSQTALRDEFATRHLLKLAEHAIKQPELSYEDVVELVASPFCALDSLQLRRLRRQLRQADLHEGLNRSGNDLLLEAFNKPGSIAFIDSPEAVKLQEFIARIETAKEALKSPTFTAENLLWHFWHESTPAKTWALQTKAVGEVAVQAGRNLDAVVALFAAANRYVERNPNGTAAAFVEDQMTLDLPQDTLAVNARDDQRVLLLTPAGLLGRRFRAVVVPQLIEGIWPNLKPRSSLLGAVDLDQMFTTKGQTDAPDELHSETRLLYKTLGAASERLIITSVDGDESQVSQFMQKVVSEVPEPQVYAAARYTLRGTVGKLRRELVTSTSEAARLEAAYGLAKLAAEGVPGADPEQWYGILDLSTEESLVILDGSKQIYVAPSQLEDFLKCPLHWFIKHHGGREGSFEANFGILLHKVLEETAEISEKALWDGVESKWHTLEFEATWLEKKEHRKAKAMVTRLAKYLQERDEAGFEVIGKEVDFKFTHEGAYVSGTVDRIERDSNGNVLIVDLKTGGKIKANEVLNHPQLGLYQLAFEKKAFGDLFQPGDKLIGARLLYVAEDASVLDQPAITGDTEYNTAYFLKLLEDSAAEMAMPKNHFIANIGSHCMGDRYAACTVQLTEAVSYVD